MRFLLRNDSVSPWCALFVPATQPGAVFRGLERSTPSPFSRLRNAPILPPDPAPFLVTYPVLLSSPPAPGSLPWRVLWVQTNDIEKATTYLNRVGPLLSMVLSAQVVFLCADSSSGAWTFIVWENGDETERGGSVTERREAIATVGLRAAFLRRTSLSFPLAAQRWAQGRDLPVATLRQMVKSTKNVRIVDYDTVAGLERKGLLVETAPVWYRFGGEPTV